MLLLYIDRNHKYEEFCTTKKEENNYFILKKMIEFLCFFSITR